MRAIVIPRQATTSPPRRAAERQRSFRRLVKWRTGSEGRISCLKRDYGWRRTRIDGTVGAQAWCAWGVLAHNATKISGLIATRERARPKPAVTARRRVPIPPTKRSVIAA